VANNRFASLELIPYSLLFEIEKYLSPFDVAILLMVSQSILEKAKHLDKEGAYEYQSCDYLDVKFRRLGINHRDRNLYPFFNTRSNAMYNILKQIGLYILTGRKDIALEMIDDRLLREIVPIIRLKKNSLHIEEHGGCTLYQLALKTYDPEIYKPLGKRIEEKFGHEVKVQQENERFPKGYKKKNYRAVFDSLIKTIAADPTIDFVDNLNIMNDKTFEALQSLENSLATDVHFDIQILVDFIDAYKANENEFQNTQKEWDQRDLYWRCGFGMLEKFMSYYIAMGLNERYKFWDVMEGKTPVTRSTVLRNGRDFFDLSLGVSHCTINARPRARVGYEGDVFRGIKNFCQWHTEKLGEQLKQQLQQPTIQSQPEVNHQKDSECRIF